MQLCCDQKNDNNERENWERVEEESVNFKPKKKNSISKLDIREWSIELRENDLRFEEENIMKKEISIKKRSLEESRSVKKAKDDLKIREIEIKEELRTLTEKKKDFLRQSSKINHIIIKMIFDCGETIELSRKYKNTECEISLNSEERLGLGKSSFHPITNFTFIART